MDPTLTNVIICAPKHKATIEEKLPGLVERFSKSTGVEFSNVQVVVDFACPPNRVHMFDRHGRRFDIVVEDKENNG